MSIRITKLGKNFVRYTDGNKKKKAKSCSIRAVGNMLAFDPKLKNDEIIISACNLPSIPIKKPFYIIAEKWASGFLNTYEKKEDVMLSYSFDPNAWKISRKKLEKGEVVSDGSNTYYIVRISYDSCVIVGPEFSAEDRAWAKENGLPLTFE